MNKSMEIVLIKNEIIKIISTQLDISISIEMLNKDIRNEFEVDSLEMMQIVVEVEKLYHIPIKDEEMEGLKTINDFIEFIETACY